GTSATARFAAGYALVAGAVGSFRAGVTYAQWDTMRRNYNQGLCHTFTVCDPNKFWSLLVY
ncbi:MAG: hypothetical protein AAFY44_17340, partial [Pseudomonadota bacterium]